MMDFRLSRNLGIGTNWEVLGLRLQSLAPNQIVRNLIFACSGVGIIEGRMERALDVL